LVVSFGSLIPTAKATGSSAARSTTTVQPIDAASLRASLATELIGVPDTGDPDLAPVPPKVTFPDATVIGIADEAPSDTAVPRRIVLTVLGSAQAVENHVAHEFPGQNLPLDILHVDAYPTLEGRTDASSLQPGQKIEASGGDVCTSSFNANIGALDVTATAGHCVGSGQTVGIYPSSTNVGSVHSFMNKDDSIDYGLYDRSSTVANSECVVTNGSSCAQNLTDFAPYGDSTGPGTYACFSGWASDLQCTNNSDQYIFSVHSDAQLQDNNGHLLWRRDMTTLNDVCSTNGDSGSPVFQGGHAFGILTGSGCSNGSLLTYFEPWEDVCRITRGLEQCGPLPEQVYDGSVNTVAHVQVGSTTDKDVTGTYTPLVGDFNCDGHDDIYWYAPGDNNDALWLSTGYSGTGTYPQYKFTNVTSPPDAVGSFDQVVVGDFNGDGCSDIFWYNVGGTNDDYFWSGQTTAPYLVSALTTNVYNSYQLTTGDFNCDGKTDLLLYNAGGGTGPEPVVWYNPMNTNHDAYTVTSLDTGTYDQVIAGHFDTNANACDSVVFYNAGTATDLIRIGSNTKGVFTNTASMTQINGTYTLYRDGNELWLYAAQPGGGVTQKSLSWNGDTSLNVTKPKFSVGERSIVGNTIPIPGDFAGGSFGSKMLFYRPG
jgi:hypothetical protein